MAKLVGDYSNSNFTNLDYNGTPNFIPVPISGVMPPPAGELPGIVTPSGFANLNDMQNTFVANSGLFQQVGNMLDQSGSSMSLCTNAPASIQIRIMRQIQPNESCWNFYKRMLNITMQYPAINPYSQPSLAEQMASNGNNILTQASSSIAPQNSYNQNPGGTTLLDMLFLAILKLIGNAVFALVLTPIKWITDGLNSLWTTVAGSSPTGALGSAGATAQPNAEAGGPVFGPAAGGGGLLGTIVIAAGNIFMNQLINSGPKLTQDVQNYDALIITNYMQSIARNSMALTWPEAVLLLPQYLALLNQQNQAQNAINYYSSNSLSSTTQNQTIPTQISTIFGLQNTYINNGLNRVIQGLTYSAIDNTICCLIKILGSLDPRFLNTILAILQLTQNRFGMAIQSLDSILNNLWTSIQKAILSTLLSILYNLMGEINASIMPVLQSSNGNINGATIQTCGSWNLFTANLLQFIGDAETGVLAMAVEFANSLKFQDTYQAEYVNNLQQSTYTKVLFNLIKIIQSALNAGALCAGSNIPTNQEIQNLLNSLPAGMNIASQPTAGTPLAAPSIPPIKLLSNCLTNVPASELAMVEAWIQALQGQS